MDNQKRCLSCTDCGVVGCAAGNQNYPEFCLTDNLDAKELADAVALYTDNKTNHAVALASAEVEGAFYGKYTRVEEIMEFAHRIGAKRIGIATCVGLINESRIFARILRLNGFEPYGAACKVGSVAKDDIGIGAEFQRKEGERMCNPILQAKLLNKAKTQLNVIVGLCVGHDSLFSKYSKALTTTLITKDRVLGHNPAAALYNTQSYYNRLLTTPLWPQEDKKTEKK